MSRELGESEQLAAAADTGALCALRLELSARAEEVQLLKAEARAAASRAMDAETETLSSVSGEMAKLKEAAE